MSTANLLAAAGKAAALIRMAGLRPDRASVAMLLRSAPRSVEESEAGPDPAESFCGWCVLAASRAPMSDAAWGRLLALASYFLDEVPRWGKRRRRAAERLLEGRVRPCRAHA